MVGLQAMVLGRMGRKPSPHPRACALSCPSPFAGRGSHTSQAGYGAPALYNACIVGRVVLPPWLHNAAFALHWSYAAIKQRQLLSKRGVKGWSFAGRLQPLLVLCHGPNALAMPGCTGC